MGGACRAGRGVPFLLCAPHAAESSQVSLEAGDYGNCRTAAPLWGDFSRDSFYEGGACRSGCLGFHPGGLALGVGSLGTLIPDRHSKQLATPDYQRLIFAAGSACQLVFTMRAGSQVVPGSPLVMAAEQILRNCSHRTGKE